MDFRLYILFTASKDLASKTIKLFTNSDFSHCALTLGKLNDKYVYISEADWEGIASSTLAYYCHKNCMFEMYEVQLDKTLIDAAIESCIEAEREHIDYAYGQTIGMSIVCALKKIGIKTKNIFTRSFNCNEWCQTRLALAGNEVCRKHLKYKDSLSPEVLRKLLIEDHRTRLLARKEFGTTEVVWI